MEISCNLRETLIPTVLGEPFVIWFITEIESDFIATRYVQESPVNILNKAAFFGTPGLQRIFPWRW